MLFDDDYDYASGSGDDDLPDFMKGESETEDDEEEKYTVTEFLETLNNILDYGYRNVTVEGEVANFKISQGKWVFFDLKDETSSVNCFLTVYKLRMELEDGMKIRVQATPKITPWGKFSLTVRRMTPIGEGNIKKGFELLKQKLEKEGLFDPLKKREIPYESLEKIGVISSMQAAGYADFCKILNARWGGMDVQVAHTMVQGMSAPDQIIQALKYFNEKAEVQVIAIIRGGGSADDLAAFNDEALVRAIAASRIPVITGIGHEVDESLADLAADARASTPSNAAEMLTRDKAAVRSQVNFKMREAGEKFVNELNNATDDVIYRRETAKERAEIKILDVQRTIEEKKRIVRALNPGRVLKQGYAIVSGRLEENNVVKITTFDRIAEAEVKRVRKK